MACSHQDQTNTLKLFRLINELGTEALKVTFDAIHPPGTLKTVFCQQDFIAKLTVLYQIKVLNKTQWEKLYPSEGDPDSKEFDISLLFTLLRNVCGLLPVNDPKWTSDPAAIAKDQSREGNIARIRWFRNEIVHNRARGIDMLTFEDYWTRISIAVVSLGIRNEDVEELRQRPLDEKLYLKMLSEEKNITALTRSVSRCEEELKELSRNVRSLNEQFRRNSNSSEPEALLNSLGKMDFTGEINFYSSRYHPKTRQWIFEAFERWYNNKDSDSKVFLVAGNPGMGKSVIAGVICKQLERANCLGGAFFCQYSNLRCRSARFLIQSIAHGLCEVLPEYKRYLLENLCHNMGQAIERMSTEELFTEFLQAPLNKVSAPVQYLVVVIDGLDECEYESKNEILRLVSLKFPRLPQWLKFFVTSRPEVNVMERLQILNPVVLQQDDEENIKDIKSFVRSNLSPFICSGDLEVSVDEVTQQAEGLMLLAYFLVTYVKHTGKAEMTFDDIRQIYPRGISSVFEDYLCHLLKDLEGYPSRRVYAFLSTVTAARAPLPVAILGKILEEDAEGPQNRRKSLGKAIDSVSVLLPVVNDHIHVFHKSFIDWLSTAEGHCDQDISQVDIKEGHRILADICRDAFEDAKRKPSFDESSPLITYSLLYGIQHLVEVTDTKETRDVLFNCITDLELIHAKLLCPCCPYYSVLEDMLLTLDVLAFEHDPEIVSSINDCLHVLKRHASILSKDPTLIYQFLFNKAETEKVVRSARICLEKNCKDVPWVRVHNKTAYQGPIRASNNCSSAITAADVSPSKEMVVFGCSNGALVLWSLTTARQMWIRNSEKQAATCCLFAPDGSYIVFGFLNNVYLLSGECKSLFPKITKEFEDCIFQAPENKAILTRDRDGAIDIWDSTNGNRLGHRLLRFGACCCKFSVCGKFVVAVTTQELYLLCSKNCTIVKRSKLAGSPLVQPMMMCVSLWNGGTGVLMCENQEVGQAFSINGSEIKCLDLPKDLRILGSARDGAFILLDDAVQADDFHIPFSVMYVPHVGGCTSSLSAIDVEQSSCLAWEGSAFFLFNISTSSEKWSIQDNIKRLMFLPSTNGASRLFSSSNMGITATDVEGHQRGYRSFYECGSFCVSQSRQWLIISQRNRMRKTSLSSGQDLELFELDNKRNIWDIRFLTEELILIVARLVIDWFDTLLLVFDAKKWRVKTSTTGHAMRIFSIDVFNNGIQVLTSDEDCNLVVWDATTFSVCTKAVIDSEEGLSVCKCAPDGKLVGSFTIGGDRIYLWKSCTLQLIQTLVFPTQSPVLGFRFESSSDYLASLSQDRVLRIWETKNGKTVSMLEFDRLPRLLAICPQSDVIAVSLENGKILLGTVHFPGFVSTL